MSELALQLIAKEKREKTGALDLGDCGLTELPKELFELEWLENLGLGTTAWDRESQTYTLPQNDSAAS